VPQAQSTAKYRLLKGTGIKPERAPRWTAVDRSGLAPWFEQAIVDAQVLSSAASGTPSSTTSITTLLSAVTVSDAGAEAPSVVTKQLPSEQLTDVVVMVHCESTQVVDRDVDVDDVCERTEPAGPPGFDEMTDTGTNMNIMPRVKSDMRNLRKKTARK